MYFEVMRLEIPPRYLYPPYGVLGSLPTVILSFIIQENMMAPRTKYDLDLFRKLVKIGKTKTEIMAEMSIKNHPTFNSLKLKLMDTDGKYYAVKESSKKAVAKKVLKAAIGKNNTLTLSLKMLESSEFNPGDYFVVKITKNKIILTLIEE